MIIIMAIPLIDAKKTGVMWSWHHQFGAQNRSVTNITQHRIVIYEKNVATSHKNDAKQNVWDASVHAIGKS